MEPFVYIARRAVPELGIQPGEEVVVEPGSFRPVVVQRQVPTNYGLLLLAAEAGDLKPLTPTDSPLRLRAAVGLDRPPASLSRRRSWRARHLKILR